MQISTVIPETTVNLEQVEQFSKIKHPNTREKSSRGHFFVKLLETIFISPITSTVTLLGRSIKLITWDLAKTSMYKIGGYHTEAADFLEGEYLKTVKALRDLIFIPSVAVRALRDISAVREIYLDDIEPKPTDEYINNAVNFNKSYEQFTSSMHGCGTFEVINPDNITEFSCSFRPFFENCHGIPSIQTQYNGDYLWHSKCSNFCYGGRNC
jgi:hypothetical protein